jgi:hypothetical protein
MKDRTNQNLVENASLLAKAFALVRKDDTIRLADLFKVRTISVVGIIIPSCFFCFICLLHLFTSFFYLISLIYLFT